MKKLISVVLCLALVLGLCACAAGGKKEKAPEGLQAGFGREIVMPEKVVGVHLNGTDTAGRVCNGFLDYLKTTCIALKDEAGTVVLLFTMDMLGITAGVLEELRPMVSQATGIPGENIIFCATHTHAAPATTGSYEGASEYKNILFNGSVKAAQTALADLSTAVPLRKSTCLSVTMSIRTARSPHPPVLPILRTL